MRNHPGFQHSPRPGRSGIHRLALAIAQALATPALLLAAAPDSRAENECGPGPTVTCAGSSYPQGIAYNTGTADLNVTLSGQVIPATPQATGVFGIGVTAAPTTVPAMGSLNLSILPAASIFPGLNGWGIYSGFAQTSIQFAGRIESTNANTGGVRVEAGTASNFARPVIDVGLAAGSSVSATHGGVHLRYANGIAGNITFNQSGAVRTTEPGSTAIDLHTENGMIGFFQHAGGSVTSPGIGVSLNANAATIGTVTSNAGSITAGLIGMRFAVDRVYRFDNADAGQITAVNGTGVLVVNNDRGVVGIDNAGSIVAGLPVSLQGNGNFLTNSGTLNGLGGTAVAVTGDSNVITLNTGAQVTGDLVAAGNNNSVLLTGAGTLRDDIRGFATLLKADAGTTWQLDGDVLNTPREAANIIVGGGTLAFTGNLGSPLANIAIAAGATLQAGTGAGVGGLSGSITNNGLLVSNHNKSLTVSGPIAGSGGLTQAGAGTTVLTADNRYTGGTQILAGTLQLGNGGGTGNITGDIANNGTLAISRSNQTILSGTISGSGGLTQSGLGTTILAGDNTYTGTTQVLSGILQIGQGNASSNAGAVTGDIDNRATLIFRHGGGHLYGGTISGNGNTIINDNNAPAGTVFSANHAYTGTTTITAGSRLTLGNGGASGSVAGDIIDDGQLWFNRSDTHLVGSRISGSGSLNISGSGTTVLTAENTYTGGTVVGAGTLQLGNGGATGNLAGAVATSAGAVLSFNRSNTLEFAGPISGAGSVVQAGTGTTVLTGDNHYTGGTTIARGTLQLGSGGAAGSLAGDIANNGILRINRSDTYTLGGAVSGSGRLVQAGTGTTVLAGNHRHTGGTQILAGTLQIGDGGSAGANAGNIDNRSRLIFSHGSDYTYEGTISGAGGVFIANQGGANTRFAADQTYTGNTTIQAGSQLTLGNGGAAGRVAGNIINHGALLTDRSDTHLFANPISGTGRLEVRGSGTTVLTAGNTYTGGSGIGAGALQLGNGGSSGSISGDVTLNHADGELIFRRADSYTFAGAIQGSGGVVQAGTGTTVLTGTSAYSGATRVDAGTLLVNGRLNRFASATGTQVGVANDATLGGTGFIDGSVALAAGAHLAPGAGGAGTLSIGGTLTLSPGALLDYELGRPDIIGSGANDLIEVGGNLLLDGALNVTDLGGFGSPGVYRLITYGGALTDNGLELGSLPSGIDPGNYAVQTSVAGQVNLVASGGARLQFWDGPNEAANGAVDGGSAVWNTSSTRWTTFDGAVNDAWGGGFAVFQGTPGTVTLGEDIALTGMQFDVNGYRVDGNGFALQAETSEMLVRVSAGGLATVDAAIVDAAATPTQLRKTDAGVLALGGANGYSGGTWIGGGALLVREDANLGNATGGVEIANGATLMTLGSFASARDITLGPGNGAISPVGDTTLTLDGTIDGAGMLLKTGLGTLVLNGANRHTGGTSLDGGMLQINGDAALGDTSGVLRFNGGSLRLGANVDFDASRPVQLDANAAIDTGLNTGTFHQAIQGTGGLIKTGPGTLVLAADNTYGGGTLIEGGILQLGNGGSAGSVTGDIVNNGFLRVRRSDTLVIDGAISGAGSLVQDGTGTTVLAADNTYAGHTLVLSGTLQIGNGGTQGNLTGDIQNDSAVVFKHSAEGIFSGRIFGRGTVAFFSGTDKGNTTLLSDQPYTGTTLIGPGTDLTLGNGGSSGSVGGAIDNQGSLLVNRSDVHVFGNAISGGGSVNLIGTGTTVLTADSRYTGGTHIGNAVLRLGNGGNSGSIIGEVRFNHADGELVFDRADTMTFDGRIVGAGGVTQAGPGTTVITQDQAYTGATTIERGTLQLGNGGSAGSIAGDITNHGLLAFVRADDYIFNGTINGSGGLLQSGSGTLILTRDHGFTGTTTISAGSHLQLGDGGSAGSVAGAIVDDGTLTFDHANDVFIAGAITGSGTVVKRGENTLTLAGDNTYTGLTTIEGGLLRIGNGGNSGAIAGDVANQGGLEFHRAGSLAYAGAIAGSGYLRQSGPGTVTLSGDNRYRGGTYLDAGTLSVGADRNLGDASGALTFDGGTLQLSARFDSARPILLEEAGGVIEALDRNKLAGQITGPGGLTKTGTGALIVNGRASYLGDTSIVQGTLVVGDSTHTDAQLGGGGDITIAAGGAFGGYGRAFGTVHNFGILGVGNALAALANEPDAEFTLVGDLVNAGTVTLVNAAAADRLIVSGTYRAAGGLLELETVLNQGGAAARSDRLQVESVAPAGAATGVLVHALGGDGAPTAGDGIMLIDVLQPTASAPGAFALARRVVAGPYEYLLQQGGIADPGDGNWYLRSVRQDEPDEEPVPIYRPEAGVYLGNRQAATSALVHSLHDRLGEPQRTQAAADEQGYLGSVWMRVLGNDLRTEAANGLISAEGGRSLFQAGAGFGGWPLFGQRDRLHLGGLLSYARSDTRVEASFNPARARGATQGALAGVYATWFANDVHRLGAYLDTWAQYGRFDNEVRGDGVDRLDYDADAWAVSVEWGYAAAVGGWTIQPQVQLLHSDYSSDTVREVNGTRIESGNGSDTLARLGIRVYPRQQAGTGMRPFIQTDWWHGGGTPTYRFNDQQIQSGVPDDRYAVKAGLEGLIGPDLALWMQLEHEWGSGAYRGTRAQLGFKYSW